MLTELYIELPDGGEAEINVMVQFDYCPATGGSWDEPPDGSTVDIWEIKTIKEDIVIPPTPLGLFRGETEINVNKYIEDNFDKLRDKYEESCRDMMEDR